MKKIVVLFFLIIIISGCQFQKPLDYSGTYKSNGGISCLLKLIHQIEDSLDFEVYCFQSNTPYHSGGIMGTVILNENGAVYETNEFKETCQLIFEFVRDKVLLSQFGKDSDCGFGQGIYAAGEYDLINSEIPFLGCMSTDNPCNLESFE